MAIHIQGETTYSGCVLSRFEKNGYHDSDFYAYVWDEEQNCVCKIMYDTTRFPSVGWAVVDATLEVIEKAEIWRSKKVAEHIFDMVSAKAVIPNVGNRVVVITKRGKNKGKSGVVIRRTANPFQTYYKNGYNKPESLYNQRVQIRTDEGEHFWIDLINTRVAGFEDADIFAAHATLSVAGFVAEAYSF